MTREEELEKEQLMSDLKSIKTQLNMILNFACLEDYVGERFARTMLLHISYLWFYGNSTFTFDYWCRQLVNFVNETLGLRKTEKKPKKATPQEVLDKIKSTKMYNNDFMQNTRNFIAMIPRTEKNHKLEYNIPDKVNNLLIIAYQKYVNSMLDFLFNEDNVNLTEYDVKDKAILLGCVCEE